MKRRFVRSHVKEALDNLPSGICFFDSRDILCLCSRQMYRLVFLLANMELQCREDLDAILDSPPARSGVVRHGEIYLFPDGTAWTFQKRRVTDSFGDSYTEYLALDVSELDQRRRALEKRNEEQHEVMERLLKISQNVMSITREEEILSMKMHIHHSLGLTLQSARSFFAQGCPPESRDSFVEEQRRMAKILLGEVGNDDEVNVYQELERTAARLNMKLITEGPMPRCEEVRDLLAMAARECLINTIRHAGGDTVSVTTRAEQGMITAVITNNGLPPSQEIAEGGGLSSLRRRIERCGGEMLITGLPRFVLTVKLPDKEET